MSPPRADAAAADKVDTSSLPSSSTSGTAARGGKRNRGRGGKHEPPIPRSTEPSSSTSKTQLVTTAGKATDISSPSAGPVPKGSKKAANTNTNTNTNTTTPTSTSTSTAGARNTKKTNKKKKKKEDGGDARVKLKVVVRRLPPNLPEKIFWQSVEPWTGKQVLLEQKKSSGQTGQTGGAGEKQVGGEAIEAGQDTDMKEVHTKEPKETVTEVDASKDIPIKSGPLIDLGSPGQDKLLWRRYLPGKFKTSGASLGLALSGTATPIVSREPSILHTYSRAYLRFKNLADLIEFHRNFDGHVFRDAAGNQSVALVEWAPYQKCPTGAMMTQGGKKRDKKEGTIEDDADYLEFVKNLQGRGEDGEEGKSREKTDAELMSHLMSNHANRDALQEASKHTPLLEHLRNQKKAEALHKASSKGKSISSTVHKGKSAKTSATHTASSHRNTEPAGGNARLPQSGKVKGEATKAAKGNDSSTSPAVPTGPKKQKGKGKSKGVINSNNATDLQLKSSNDAKASTESVVGRNQENPSVPLPPPPPTGPKNERKQKGSNSNKKGNAVAGEGKVGAGSSTTPQPMILKRAGTSGGSAGPPSSGAGAGAGAERKGSTRDPIPSTVQQSQQPQQQQQQQPRTPTGPKNPGRGARGGKAGGKGGKAPAVAPSVPP